MADAALAVPQVAPTGELAREASAPATRRAHRADLAVVRAWAASRAVDLDLAAAPMAPEHLAAFVEDAAAGRLPGGRPRKPATVARYVASVAALHQLAVAAGRYPAGAPSPAAHPLVRLTLRGLRRASRGAPQRRVAPVDLRLLQRVADLPDDAHGRRDRALLVVGWASGCRRAELAALDLADVAVVDGEGVLLHLRHSKTDQEGHGRSVELPWGSAAATCPGRTLLAWLAVRGGGPGEGGPLFLEVQHGAVKARRISGRTVCRAVQRLAAAAGLDPRQFGGHSLRAGVVTALLDAGRSYADVQRLTGHRSVATVGRYYRPRLTGHAPAAGLGL